MPISIAILRGTAQLNDVRLLMRAFIAWHRQRHAEDIHLIDQYFDSTAFENELRTLPGAYVPPRGQLLLATYGGTAAGCVALREVNVTSCEMKRMFVYERFHGQGVGRALAMEIIAQARSLGYQRMLLDTSIRQAEAQGLYTSLGFGVIAPYYELPKAMRDWLIFMELRLEDAKPE
jgi:GNAT superfamily N-acetyltransferase